MIPMTALDRDVEKCEHHSARHRNGVDPIVPLKWINDATNQSARPNAAFALRDERAVLVGISEHSLIIIVGMKG